MSHRRCFVALSLALALSLGSSLVHAQLAPQAPLPDSKSADLGHLKLEYFEFGNTGGPPVVFLQDFHDYFRLEEAARWRKHLARFGDEYRVLAPTRRGYGASDDPRWGFDVPTLGEDIVRFLDAMDIRKAVLVGRIPATQEMAWIAEHHPDRLAGLVFIDQPLVFNDMRDADVRAWAEAFWKGACDLGSRAIDITGPRTSWQPHFLTDPARRIDVPAMLLIEPRFSGSMDLHILGMLERTPVPPSCAAGVQEYYEALKADPVRLRQLREKLVAGDRSTAVAAGMARAFGPSLQRIEYSLPPPTGQSATEMPEPWYTHSRAFLDALHAKGAWK